MVEATQAVQAASRHTKRGVLRFLLLAALFLVAVAASLLMLKFAPASWFWLWLTWAAAPFAGIFLVQRSWPRAILFNLGIVALLLAAVEAYYVTHEYVNETFPDGGFYVADDVMGWVPAKAKKTHVVKYGPAGLLHGPEGILFDRTYTIDSNGLRVAPPYRQGALAGTILFFGCSFAFGDGLADDETFPYQVGLQSGGRYRIFNFAFQGYGPHQMLAAIEHGMVRRVVDATPQYAIYVALPIHVSRVAGRGAFGGHAPRYVLDEKGIPREAGHFGDRKPLFERLGFRRGEKQLGKSAIYRRLSKGGSRINDDDTRLYLAVVHRSEELLTAQYPGLQFHVILWPYQRDEWQLPHAYEKIREGFRQIGISYSLVEGILPGYTTDRSPYILSSVDWHPNALANRLLAHYVVDKILR
jgi:hypothetical protein